MPATEIQLYDSGDLFGQGEYPTLTKWNDNVLIKHQDEFERRDMLVYKWLQQLVVDDSVANTAIYNNFDVVLDGKRYYAESLSIDMTSATDDVVYHVRFLVEDMELHIDTVFEGDGLYIGTTTKNSSDEVTSILSPVHMLSDGIMATIVALMPSDSTTSNAPLLLRFYSSALEVSIDNGATWTQVGTGGGVTAHDALTHLGYADAGHTGFQPAMGSDDNYVTDAELANLHAPGSDNQDLSTLALKTNVLELDNTDAFVPTTDYHPATKKFVDDHVGGGVTDHSLLTNLEYENSGHTGFESARGVDDNFVTSAQLAAIDSIPAAETGSTLRTKLGITTLTNSNTGDENLASIKSKLGITTLSGANRGDQIGDGTTITGAGTVADPFVATGGTPPVKATYSEVDTGTNDTKFVTPLALQTSVRNVRHLGFCMVAPDVSLAASTSVPVGFSVESEIAGVIVSCGANNDTAGTTGTAVYDIHLNGTTIMSSTKISIETGEASSKTAATQPVLTTTALAVGDMLTFFVDSIQSTAALGVTFKLNVRET